MAPVSEMAQGFLLSGASKSLRCHMLLSLITGPALFHRAARFFMSETAKCIISPA